MNLLGIAIKVIDRETYEALSRPTRPAMRITLLEKFVGEHSGQIAAIVSSRRNSFTAPRRFLIPQVILGAVFARHKVPDLAFADLGTGLGIMPRQLNNKMLFSRFGTDLSWPNGTPRFRSVPVQRVIGVDRGPLPDLEWVQSCYGSSRYYTKMFDELLSTLDVLAQENEPTELIEVDLLDTAMLAAFLRDNRIHAVNMSYVLYEIERGRRDKIVQTVLEGLRPPGIVVITEPRGELTQQGCDVLVHCHDRPAPYKVCRVSDGHFTGEVTALSDYLEFTAKYPIECD